MSVPLHELVAGQLEAFAAASTSALVIENGEVLFDLATARYSLRAEGERCVLQLWSEERNILRRVVAAEVRQGILKLEVLRFGQTKPARLEICPNPKRPRQARQAAFPGTGSAAVKRATRAVFQRLLRRQLEAVQPKWTIQSLVAAADLEHSFGPTCVRGLLRRGTSAMAVVGVAPEEPQAIVDGAVATAVLWLEHCRQRQAATPAARFHIEGVRLYLPRGRAAVARLRLAHLDHTLARWQLFEYEPRTEETEEIDVRDAGNFQTRLVQAPDRGRALERFAACIERVRAIMPAAEVDVVSAGELSFRRHGLQFARAVMAPAASFGLEPRLVFADANGGEVPLDEASEPRLREVAACLETMRTADGDANDSLYRSSPERWLEARVKADPSALDNLLDPGCLYSQVPAFAAGDRAMIDLLGVTRQGRLVVVELKADEELQLPLQGLDYWARVRWHQERGEFQRFGYFPGRQLSAEPPLLVMAAPSLHVHPTTDTLLRHLSPAIEWRLLGLDERWRQKLRVIFRKSSQPPAQGAERER